MKILFGVLLIASFSHAEQRDSKANLADLKEASREIKHKETEFAKLVSTGRIDQAIEFLKKPGHPQFVLLNAKIKAVPVLVYSIRNGHQKLAQELMTTGSNLNARDEKTGQTALIAAVVRQNDELVKKLLELGADKEMRANNGKSPLDYAKENGLNKTSINLLK